MALFTLHADFDHTGKINATASEYQLRNQLPGVLVIPNLDVDRIAWPTEVKCGSAPMLDENVTTKTGNDNDLIPILIKVAKGTLPRNFRVLLKISHADAAKVNLYDATRHRMTSTTTSGFTIYELKFTSSELRLYLESITVMGSPLQSTPAIPTINFGPSIPKFLELQLEVTDLASGKSIEKDSCIVTPSPLFLLGDHAWAERIYMCEISGSPASLSDNFPSFQEVKELSGKQRDIHFIPVPLSVSNGDSWVQDQFQVGYFQNAHAHMKVIFHLPRLRSDTRLTTAANGLSCIATNHFPSTNLGVFDDFWKRSLTVPDAAKGSQTITFQDTVTLQILLNKAWEEHQHLLNIIEEVCHLENGDNTKFDACIRKYAIPAHFLTDDLFVIIQQLNEFKDRVVRILKDAKKRSEDNVILQRLENTTTDIESTVTTLLSSILVRSDNILVARTTGFTLVQRRKDFNELVARLDQLHSSHNYGGNIEVTPPMSTAPLGKVIVGNNDSISNSIMDPEIIGFLSSQPLQPLVTVDTTWLHVGHVDEVLNFAAYDKGKNFAVILASPLKAYEILEEIFILSTQHLSDANPEKELYAPPFSQGDATLAKGPHPVTRMLRGKHWLQAYRKNDKRVMPPKIYNAMNFFYGDFSSTPRPFYPIAWPEDHYYDAAIGVRELLYFSLPSKQTSLEKMQTIIEQIGDEFQDQPFIELPVIFDYFSPSGQTIAFTPDIVNYQTLNHVLLLPRPYGPRMTVEDTITILRKVMGEEYYSKLSRQNIRAKQLHVTYHWTVNKINQLTLTSRGPEETPLQITLDLLAEQFKDGFFPETSDIDEIKRLIRKANPGKFLPDGYLKPGWHKLKIPENKVDVFETYTQVMFESIGLTVQWIDSWYYHIRSGGIHCGTNVIRTPDLSPAKAWWKISLPTSALLSPENVTD